MKTVQPLRADLGIAERFLRATEESPALEIIQVKGKGEHAYPPIVCLHGASSGAWMWEEFLRVLGARRRPAAALSLRGHGRSDGRDELKSATLDDYAQDVLRAFSEFDEPPILITHSLGSLIAGRFLGRTAMRALVLLAPLPPEGMFWLSLRLLAIEPIASFEAARLMLGFEPRVPGPLKDYIFSPRFSSADIDRHVSRMVPEGARLWMEAHLPQPVMPAYLAGVPALVIGGDKDRLVPAELFVRTAVFHGADCRLAEGFGHLLHVEPRGSEIAHATLDWLEERGL
jgi:pimeloyl-ACP methyl ester carboxylesterase